MFPTGVIERFLKETSIEEAIEKVNQYSKLMDLDPDAARSSFKAIWDKHQKAQAEKAKQERLRVLSKSINGTPIELLLPEGSNVLNELAEYLSKEGTLTLEVVQDEDEGTSFVIRTKAHLVKDAVTIPAGVNRTRSGSGSRISYRYFHRGEVINGALAKFLRDNYPTSQAVARLNEVDAKFNSGESKSKLGAWQAVVADKDLADMFDREEVNA